MSFSTDQKAEIISQPIKNQCCKKATLNGLLAARGRVNQNMCSCSVDSSKTAEYMKDLIKEIYSQDATITTSKSGGRRRIVSFESKSCAKYLTGIAKGEELFTQKCGNCLCHFLKGLFVGSGRVSDPMKQYSLEFSVGESKENLCNFFEELGMTPRVSKKPNETVIYFKNSAYLEDFFAISGMNSTAFALMNAKINNEIRNNVNRVSNCETNNIGKAVNASMSQIALIQKMSDHGYFSHLSEELEMTAKMRLLHRDLSLSQLALLFTPHITKSGLSHRLKKITSIAENLLNGEKD